MSRLLLSGLLLLAPALAHAEDMAPSALNSLTSVPAGIVSAQGMDQNGHALGKVERGQTDQDGKPPAVSIRSNAGRTVVVAAAEVSFDGRMVVTSSDQPQIAELIGAPTRTAAK